MFCFRHQAAKRRIAKQVCDCPALSNVGFGKGTTTESDRHPNHNPSPLCMKWKQAYFWLVAVSRHFGPKTFRHYQTGAEVSGQFGTSAEVSFGYFGTGAELSRPR